MYRPDAMPFLTTPRRGDFHLMNRSQPGRRVVCLLAGVAVAALLSGCASAPPVVSPSPGGPSDAAGSASTSALAQPVIRWPVKTAEHVDLWIHSFALLVNDSAPVPLYRRGYRDSLTVVKNRANVLTALDANRSVLATGLAASGGYLQAQFLPLDMPNWDVMRSSAERFLQYEGDPRRAPDRETAARVAQFASVFPGPADREWLRLFIAGVADEQLRFFADEHARAVRSRVAVITAVDSLWQQVYRARFDRFLANTGQRTGDLVLSLPVGGEGRTGVGRDRQTVVVVPLPERTADAAEALYVFAHEITGTLVGTVVADNTTPAEQRAGAADRHVSVGQVRAGALLLERVAPELLDPYMRYYLRQVGAAGSDATVAARFARQFDLPTTIRDALQRQLDIVLGGI